MLDWLGLPYGAFALAAAGVFIGTMLQRLAGQAFGMVAAPIMAMAAPQYLPASLLLLGLFVGLTSAALATDHITRSELPWGFSGRALGAGIAVMITAFALEPESIRVVVAGVVFLGIFLSLVGLHVPIRPASLFTAGTVAGIMGTLTAVGAPPMALLYQHEQTDRAAAMQNVFFFWGMCVSIGFLAVAGLVTVPHIGMALALAPFSVLALFAAQPLAARVARRAIRPWALGFAGLAATVLLAQSLL